MVFSPFVCISQRTVDPISTSILAQLWNYFCVEDLKKTRLCYNNKASDPDSPVDSCVNVCNYRITCSPCERRKAVITSAGRLGVSKLPILYQEDEWEWSLKSWMAPVVAVYYGVVLEGHCVSASATFLEPSQWRERRAKAAERRGWGQWEGCLQAQPNGLIGTLAVSSLAEPAIRPAAVGRGRRPPQGAVSLLPDTLQLKRYNNGCVQLCNQNPESRHCEFNVTRLQTFIFFPWFKIQELNF